MSASDGEDDSRKATACGVFKLEPGRFSEDPAGCRLRLLRRLIRLKSNLVPAATAWLDGDLRAALLRPIQVEELAARGVDAFVRVGAKVIALALQEIGR